VGARGNGFTLIEILAVVVILGILAGILVPRFSDMTEQARRSALLAAIAEGQARVNAAAARYALSAGALPTAYSQVATFLAQETDAGGYLLAFGDASGGVAMTAWYAASPDVSATGFAVLPQ